MVVSFVVLDFVCGSSGCVLWLCAVNVSLWLRVVLWLCLWLCVCGCVWGRVCGVWLCF